MQPSFGAVAGANIPENMENVEKSCIEIPVRDGSTIPALLYRPITAPKGDSPLLVAYHGGGWCIGTPDLEEVNW